jgi:RNA polymerase sigma-70 factor, ECF subfamily
MTSLLAVDPLRSARSGDAAAFSLLIEPLLTHAHRLACGMLLDADAAEDAVQEAALKAWRKLHRLREGSELRPWFLGIVANECRSLRRSSWRRVLVGLPDRLIDKPQGPGPAEIDLRRAIGKLRARRRAVVVMHWYLDLPLSEIASALHSSEDAVESQLRRGIADLRRQLGVWEKQ